MPSSAVLSCLRFKAVLMFGLRIFRDMCACEAAVATRFLQGFAPEKARNGP
jgi:hypothetical protein